MPLAMLALLFSLVGFAGLAGAVPTEGGAVPTPDQIRAATQPKLPYGEGVLWRVAREGEAPSYVFGTIHLNRDDILAVPEAVRKALAGARSAAFEVLFDDDGSRAMREAQYTGGHRTLDALIGPDLFSQAVKAARPYGLSVHQLRNMQPWALALIFNKPPSVAQSEDEGKPMLDRWLFEQAESKGIPVFGLETMHQHLTPFLAMSPEEQKQMIKDVIAQQDADQTEVERRHAEMVRHYLDGDIGAIMGMAGDEADSAEAQAAVDAFQRRLFEDRNYLMVERMLPRLQEGKAFVAVGAGHLPGHEGILSLLTGHGYSVERVH